MVVVIKKNLPRFIWKGIPEYLKSQEHQATVYNTCKYLAQKIFSIFYLVCKLYELNDR
jgi:hypothetical protein